MIRKQRMKYEQIVENEEQLQERKEKWVKKILYLSFRTILIYRQNSPYAIRQSKELVNHMTSGIVNEYEISFFLFILQQREFEVFYRNVGEYSKAARCKGGHSGVF